MRTGNGVGSVTDPRNPPKSVNGTEIPNHNSNRMKKREMGIAPVLSFAHRMKLSAVKMVKAIPGKKHATLHEMDFHPVASPLKLDHILTAT